MEFYSPDSLKSFWFRHYRLKQVRDILSYYYYSSFPKFSVVNEFVISNTTPVIINNFNRLKPLDELVKWLRTLDGAVSIIILDNHSTYPPLLDYYHTLTKKGVCVIRLDRNRGTDALLPLALSVRNTNKFVITDADLVPYPTTPKDILGKMCEVLDRYQSINHVGASLEVNDLPDHYPLKDSVIKWESQFWTNKFSDQLYIADIDTTFAMYRAGANVRKVKPALRMNRPYTFSHVDWYVNPDSIDAEYKFYLSTCSNIATWCTKFKETINSGLQRRPQEAF